MNQRTPQASERIIRVVRQALDEDVGSGDITTQSILSADLVLGGQIVSKEEGVLAGLQIAELVFQLVDERIKLTPSAVDGDPITTGQTVAKIRGPGIGILSGERVALNFLQRMSGIATLTRRFADAVKGSKAVILDTRKTAPGLRILDKLAVTLGGGGNHRFGLYDMVLIKDNHIAAAGGIAQAIKKVREVSLEGLAIEVEVSSMAEFQEALALQPDRIMLDNMSLHDMSQAVALTAGRVELEASGNVTLDNVADIAAAGVDFISVGALTHSVRALDISLEIMGPL